MEGQFSEDYRSKERTEGDGMETVLPPESLNKSRPSISTPGTSNRPRIPSVDSKMPVDRLISLTPKKIYYVGKKKRISKEPKFVPYEPYKAATKPILPTKVQGRSPKKASKNNLDVNILASQLALMDTNPNAFEGIRNRTISLPSEKNVKEIPDAATLMQWNSEKIEMQQELDSLREENQNLKGQIKQQAQVNKELKTMLIASMGEDLETRVQTLTEDKQQLASALLNSAQHLSTHQEQTEWLAGQCEVWRSKFLASSLMVEELAGWKRAFTKRTDELQITLRNILEERNRIRDILIHTHRNLQSLHENWLTNLASKELYYTSMNEIGGFSTQEHIPLGRINLSSSRLKTSNILDLASINLKFSENICTGVEKLDDITSLLNELPMNTDAENLAEKLLAEPLEVSEKNDQSSFALVNHAYRRTGMAPNIACCSHCNGQVQLL